MDLCVWVCLCVLSYVWLFATPWTVARQAPLSVEFPRQEYRVGCHFLLHRTVPTQGLCLRLLCWQADFFTTVPSGKTLSSTCLFITSLSESKKPASPYPDHIYLFAQLEDILSFKIAKLYSYETQIYQLHCSLCSALCLFILHFQAKYCFPKLLKPAQFFPHSLQWDYAIHL